MRLSPTYRRRGCVDGPITSVIGGPGNESEFGDGFGKDCESVSGRSFRDGDGWKEMRRVELGGR